MKALSIRQPWARAITHYGKRIENRSWRCHYRGPVLIHASLWKGRDANQEFLEETVSMIDMARSAGVVFPAPITGRDALDWPRGGIVGAAKIVDCIEASESPWFVGPFGIVLADVRPLPFVPMKGALGFFDVPADVLAKLGLEAR